ncbi:MAG: hypothetical protein JWL84_6287, partial [Rhodospirillales bacterium]|nr:hypothetical protein [Rhodospirillales bacterium]
MGAAPRDDRPLIAGRMQADPNAGNGGRGVTGGASTGSAAPAAAGISPPCALKVQAECRSLSAAAMAGAAAAAGVSLPSELIVQAECRSAPIFAGVGAAAGTTGVSLAKVSRAAETGSTGDPPLPEPAASRAAAR